MTHLKITRSQTLKLAGLLALSAAALSTPLVGNVRANTILATTTTPTVVTSTSASPRVTLNGQPLATSVAPQIVGGVTMVPMRDIFEALGATVVWVPQTQEIRANKGATNIQLQIGNMTARVGETSKTLSEAPIVDRGSTLVPLRFVSESLGANVTWDSPTRVAAISTSDRMASTSTGAMQTDVKGNITIPSGAVIPVTLDQTISSKDAKVGDKFSATVKSEKAGDSEFPPGTKIWGRVSEVQSLADGQSPGVLGLEFTGAQLPDGTRIALDGDMISLDDQSVTQSNGRVMAKDSSGKKKGDIKAVGIGAGAGFVLGKLIRRNSIITSILGAGAGYLYSKKQDKGKEQEAVVDKGSAIGVRLTRTVNYTDTSYYNERAPYLGNG